MKDQYIPLIGIYDENQYKIAQLLTYKQKFIINSYDLEKELEKFCSKQDNSLFNFRQQFTYSCKTNASFNINNIISQQTDNYLDLNFILHNLVFEQKIVEQKTQCQLILLNVNKFDKQKQVYHIMTQINNDDFVQIDLYDQILMKQSEVHQHFDDEQILMLSPNNNKFRINLQFHFQSFYYIAMMDTQVYYGKIKLYNVFKIDKGLQLIQNDMIQLEFKRIISYQEIILQCIKTNQLILNLKQQHLLVSQLNLLLKTQIFSSVYLSDKFKILILNYLIKQLKTRYDYSSIQTQQYQQNQIQIAEEIKKIDIKKTHEYTFYEQLLNLTTQQSFDISLMTDFFNQYEIDDQFKKVLYEYTWKLKKSPKDIHLEFGQHSFLRTQGIDQKHHIVQSEYQILFKQVLKRLERLTE